MTGPLPPRVAVATVSAVGNAVHLLPVLHSLKHHSPDTHVTCVAQPGAAALLQGHPAVDEVLLFHRGRGWRGLLELRYALAERPFDLLLNLQAYFKSGVVAALARAPVKLGYDRARARDLT
ncbi:MAG: hypothetical protein M3P24_10435, partial [Gemmatimonadota bacterium]|nr:hypothetical protein [Gemmatimonadota bacterium]